MPRGTNCQCTPFPELSGNDLSAKNGRSITVANDSVNGATTASVLEQLKEPTVDSDVRHANAIELEIGANDVSYSDSCGTKVSCYEGKLPTLEKNLAAIVARTHELAAGHRPVVVLLDYWSVWLGGKYAAARGQAYVDAAEEMTDRVDQIIQTTAADTRSDYVDLRAAFKGPDYAYDETHYLSNDGDHPNAAGHRQIADALGPVLTSRFR